MQAQGQIRIEATPARIAAALRDPAVLQAILPACTGVTPRGPDAYAAEFARDVGPMKLGLSARLQLAPTEGGQTLLIEGASLLTGAVTARCDMRLIAAGTGTDVAWDGSVTLRGMVRKLAETAAPDAADRVVGKMFQRLKARLEAPGA